MTLVEQDPLEPFFYALKSRESRRQYPKRLKMFLDFIELGGSLEEQTKLFLSSARQDVQSVQGKYMRFIEYHKEQVRKGEKAGGTVINYYRAFKLFCDMNDIQLNWKRISK
jgi:hypothetical protein